MRLRAASGEMGVGRRVAMQWGMSSFFGWGVYGLNLALAWARDPEVEALTTRPLNLANVNLDPP